MRYLLYTLLVIVCLITGGITFLLIAAPTDFVRDQAIAAVKESTGRDLIVRGKSSFTFFPDLGIELDKVSLSAPSEMQGAPLIEMGQLKVVVPILPLLRRQIEIDRFVLVRPKISMRVDANGRRSWEFKNLAGSNRAGARERNGTAKRAQDLPPELKDFIAHSSDNEVQKPQGSRGASSESSRINGLRLGEVRIVDGVLSYVDERSGGREVLRRINVNFGLDHLDGPLEANGHFSWKGEVVPFAAKIASLQDLIDARATNVSTSVTSKLLKARYNGSVNLGTSLSARGQIEAGGQSIRKLAAWLGEPLPNTNGYGDLSLTGNLELRGHLIALDKAQLVVGSAKGQGNVSVDLRRARPRIKADLTIEKLVLDDFVGDGGAAPSPTGSNGSNTKREIADLIDSTGAGEKGVRGVDRTSPVKAVGALNAWDESPIYLRGLRSFDAEARIVATEMIFSQIRTGPAKFVVNLESGVLNARLQKIALYNGHGKGTLQVDSRPRVPEFKARFNVSRVSARPFLKDATDFDWIAGQGNVAIKINSHGRSQREIVSALVGDGRFSFNDGAIVGVNIPQLLRGLGRGQMTNLKKSEAMKTDFTLLSGSFTIKRGVAQNRDLKLVGPFLRLSGAGIVDLPIKQVDYRVKPKLVASAQGQGGQGTLPGLEIPMIIKGSWDNPKIAPDISGALENPQAAVDTVKNLTKTITKNKAVKETINQLKNSKDVDKLLKGLFGSQGG